LAHEVACAPPRADSDGNQHQRAHGQQAAARNIGRPLPDGYRAGEIEDHKRRGIDGQRLGTFDRRRYDLSRDSHAGRSAQD
jgi:hypothetical protein